jgi:dimethylamine/trimethylamine dehydrogenase
LESELPGLIEWRRVMDWRLTQINKLPNVEFFPSSHMTAEEVIEASFKHVFVATGATWRKDGIGRNDWKPIPGYDLSHVYTPDDLLAGKQLSGDVVVYDDDHYYMGGVLAELLVSQGCRVTLVTPARMPSAWTVYTLEQERIEKRLLGLGVQIITNHRLSSIQQDECKISQMVSGDGMNLPCRSIVLVTDRLPLDELYYELLPHLESGELLSLRRIGDCETPHLIAQAVYSGHLAAREFGESIPDGTPFKVERTSLED